MDRRTVWAILLMMVIAITPAIFIKRPPPRPVPGSAADSAARSPAAGPSGSAGPAATAAPADTTARVAGAADRVRPAADSGAAAPAASPRTLRVTSPLYTYGISTAGARLDE